MILHIGLGKTATTTIQKHIFPELKERGIIDEYNPPQIMKALRRCVATNSDIKDLKKEIAELPSNSLVSLESLVGWNPEVWKESAERNLELFGSDTTILVTIRDPKAYLTSVYVQMVHQGNLIAPEQFFLRDSEYNEIRRITRPDLCEIFKVDDLDFKFLLELYGKIFKKVVVIPLQSIAEFQYLPELFPSSAIVHNHEFLNDLTIRFNSAKRENRAYSVTAMKLTFHRKRFLRLLGLKSINSFDGFYELYAVKIEAVYSSENDSARASKRLPTRLLSKLVRLFRWRTLMQNLVDRIIPYKKFELPSSVYLGRHIDKNNELYSHILASEKGYYVSNKFE